MWDGVFLNFHVLEIGGQHSSPELLSLTREQG